MATDFEKASAALQKAVQTYVGGFGQVPAEWAKLAAKHIDNDELYAMPMWGTVFIVSGMDTGPIEKLLCDPVPTDAAELIAFAEEHHIEIEESEMKLLALAASDDDHSDEIDKIRQNIMNQWMEGGSDDASLASFGWQDVGKTGIHARTIDGNLVLGINGMGYDFYEAHWMPLYLAVGYKWHENSEPLLTPKRKKAKVKKAKTRKRKAG